MPIGIPEQQLQQIEAGPGYGLSGAIGGLPRTTYYTPDGRVIRALPNIHVNQASQSRDANLDKGWLLAPPTVLKPFCRACDRWHNTQTEVDACIARQQQFVGQAEKKARDEQTDHLAALELQVAALTALVQKLTGGNGDGSLLQPASSQPSGEVPSKVGS